MKTVRALLPLIAMLMTLTGFLAADWADDIYDRLQATPLCETAAGCDQLNAVSNSTAAIASVAAMQISAAQLFLSLLGSLALLYTLYLTQIASRAAVLSANSAQQSLQSTERTAQAQLRAYIFAKMTDGGGMIPAPDGSERYFISTKVVLSNAGATPAGDVKMASRVTLATVPDPAPPQSPPDKWQEQAAIPPHDGTTLTSVQYIKKNIEDHERICISVWVSYLDVFGKIRSAQFHWVAANTKQWLEAINTGVKNLSITWTMLSKYTEVD